ncbi:DUF4249 family protein [Muribaculum intestinale]|uniref:DUF4249 family protein n=1 Tax=Muribaculum intestinale TaxID=1796646 RepID=UPI0025A9ADAA|nr:DUF4249 family protein [Muribaculum intestinale]
MKRVFYIVTACLILVSCQKTIDDDTAGTGRLVVEGWIDSGGHPTVILTRSFSPMSTESTTLSDLVVRWANVTISDGERTETMIGRIDNSMTPPFVYTTAQITGVPGRTYTITAESEGERIVSSCTMPRPVDISRIDVAPVADSDTLREVSLTFVPGIGNDKCYQLAVYDPSLSGRMLPCFMGAYAASSSGGGGEVTLTVCRPSIDTDGGDYTPYFRTGRTIMVALTAIAPEVWRFWHEYDDFTAFGGNIFLAGTIPMHGNIDGGYGIWSARGVDVRTIIIE